MTRYEFFEGWLTSNEWRTWKKHSVNRSIAMQGVSRDTAKAIRDRYLREQTPFDTNNHPEVCDAWDDMISYRLRWRDTPEGHSHWERVCMRTAPVRTLTPLTIVTNRVN